jgi:hypothetical protein
MRGLAKTPPRLYDSRETFAAAKAHAATLRKRGKA